MKKKPNLKACRNHLHDVTQTNKKKICYGMDSWGYFSPPKLVHCNLHSPKFFLGSLLVPQWFSP